MLVTKKLVMTKDIGCNDNLFGGNIMQWADECAAIYAMEYTGEPRMVTLKFEEMLFKSPVKVGEIIDFNASALVEGETSFKFHITANVGNRLVLSVDCVFVCVDQLGRKKAIEKFKRSNK